MKPKTPVLSAALALLLASGAVWAQDLAPTPRKMPRTPVSRQNLTGSKAVLPTNHVLSGAFTVLDSERLRLGDHEVRLFGIVPPSLSASFGPQARAALDVLVASGTVSCTIRDRDRDGRYLATCQAPGGLDPALELLKRGLAVTARGSLQPTDLATPYQAAEQAAQAQKTGLWSVTQPRAVSESALREAAKAPDEALTAVKDSPAKDKEKEEAPKAEGKTESAVLPVTVSLTGNRAKAEQAPPPAKAETPPPLPAPQAGPLRIEPLVIESTGFFERYQLLVTGILMLLTALGIVAAVLAQRWFERREDVRAIAAALRGELMAARAVCLARIHATAAEADGKTMAWPRIRSLVFQAYVGRLGLLGAVLSRQIASIYGQASDYAAYYNSAAAADGKGGQVSKRQALQTLLRHIEEVLPRLVAVEQKRSPGLFRSGSVKPAAAAPAAEAPAFGTEMAGVPFDDAAPPAEEALPSGPVPSPTPTSAPLWSAIRRFATERLEPHQASRDTMEDHIPDYTAMSEDERFEAMHYKSLFGDESETPPPAPGKTGLNG